MADWSKPTLTSLYTDFLTEVKNRDDDLAKQFDGTTSSNVPTGAIRWDSAANRWKKWSGSAWDELASTYALTGLSTSGNASIGGTLAVTGTSTFTGAATFNGGIAGNPNFSGSPTIGSVAIVTVSGTQTLTNKTLTSPTINTASITGGTVATATITSPTLSGGTINNTPIGGTTANSGAFTTLSASGQVTFSGTGAVGINAGTTAQRPGSPGAGFFRFNSTLGKFEGYNGSAWGAVGGGATGGGSDAVFHENDQTVTANYTITTGKNAMSAGPISVASGITITIPSGAVWSIV